MRTCGTRSTCGLPWASADFRNVRFVEDLPTIVAVTANNPNNIGELKAEMSSELDASPNTLVETWKSYYAASNACARSSILVAQCPWGMWEIGNWCSTRNQALTFKVKRVPVAADSGGNTTLSGPTLRLLSKDVAYLSFVGESC